MLTLQAPAKINWFLRVLRKRPDGYHEIQSLVQRVSLADDLRMETADGLHIGVDGADIPIEQNLVLRAARTLQDAAGTRRGARIHIIKHIPVAAGLGGGSSDAASALAGLNRLWECGLSHEELMGLATSLGSDVPFFLNGSAAIIEGRGERVSHVNAAGGLFILLAKPDMGVSAGWAYARVTPAGDGPADAGTFLDSLNAGDFSSLSALAFNDLEDRVLAEHAEVAALKERMLESGAALALMSGSGSTVFGLFRSAKDAEEAKRTVNAPWSAVVETIG